MHFLFYDTETTGKPKNYKAHVHDVDNWPRLVQLAWILVRGDEAGQTVLASANQLVKPSGKWAMSSEAEKIHGLSPAKLEREGLPSEYVLGQFMFALQLAEVQVGHNIGYDWKVMGAELLRVNLEDQYQTLKCGAKICTMMSYAKANKCKWPKLNELYNKLFSEDFDGAHDAMADIQATRRCFFKMQEMGIV